jgi:hypothetical protein
MRLLNAKTRRLEEFFDKEIPKYAILSHTWGDNEITFKEFDRYVGLQSTSTKIDGCCAQALRDGIVYVWIDTVCIDKSSSSELSEAINSMYAWYEKTEVCYVYLSDVVSISGSTFLGDSELSKSRWFKRGWTLQELLAPSELKVYNQSWASIGHVFKNPKESVVSLGRNVRPRIIDAIDLGHEVSWITGIPEEYVYRKSALDVATIAEKMCWASQRQTTRIEDFAYCLLGIFGVAMPLIYGEGKKAFLRLQEEIIKNDDDHSIFAWGYEGPNGSGASCFASSPAEFARCSQVRKHKPAGVKSTHYTSTNKGLHIEMSLLRLITGDYVGRIHCSDATDVDSWCIAIPLVPLDLDDKTFYRPHPIRPERVPSIMFVDIDPCPIYISRLSPAFKTWKSGITLSQNFLAEFTVETIHPPTWQITDGEVLHPSDMPIGPQRRTILLNCVSKNKSKFVVRVDYTFNVNKPGYREPFSRLTPRSAKIYAARLPWSISLLELMVCGDQRIEWREDFYLEQHRVLRDDGSSTISIRRLQVDTSRSEWTVEIATSLIEERQSDP